MNGTLDTDGQMTFDRMLEAALRNEADLVAMRQPGVEAALGRLAMRLGVGHARPVVRQLVVLAWVALLLIGLLVAAIVGMQLLEQRQEIESRRLGLGVPCAVDIEPGVFLEISKPDAPGSRTTTYFDTGYVTEVSIGNLGFSGENRRRTRAVVNSMVFSGKLMPDELAAVRARLDALDLAAGCHSVRVPALTGERAGSFVARAGSGPVQLSWSADAGESGLAPLFTGEVAQELRDLHVDLGMPTFRLPAEAWEQAPDSETGWFMVHAVFVPTDYRATDVLEYPGVPPASATDGRYAGVKVPGDSTLEDLGTPMSAGDPSGRGATQRCAVASWTEARDLAVSLEEVAIGLEGEPDLYTPDMALAVSVEIYPKRSIDSCATFEAELRNALEPRPRPDPITGDLANVDPCSLVPGDLLGRIDDIGYRWPTPPFGLAGAPSCVLENHASMGVWSKRVTLWLYPRSISEASAATLAAALFGDGLMETEIDGRAGWLNFCVIPAVGCTGAAATWIDGQFLLLELFDVARTANEGQTPQDLLARIAAYTAAR